MILSVLYCTVVISTRKINSTYATEVISEYKRRANGLGRIYFVVIQFKTSDEEKFQV